MKTIIGIAILAAIGVWFYGQGDMTAIIGIAILVALGVGVWLYDHGLANVLEALAIRLILHAQWLRARHERQERIQAGKLLSLTARLVPEVEGVEVQR